MKVPDWMELPLFALGIKPEDFKRDYENVNYEAVHTAQILDKLFAANMLNLELPE